jgi:transposase InsO family protein
VAHHQGRSAGAAAVGPRAAKLRRQRTEQALWVADLTYLRCWEGLVFFAFVLDAYSRMTVGWQLAGHMRTDLVLDA